MPKYEVTVWEKVTRTVIVEAENEEEAQDAGNEAAWDEEPVSQGTYAVTVNEVGA